MRLTSLEWCVRRTRESAACDCRADSIKEEETIAACVADLVNQGIQVYLLDDDSPDRTFAEVERFKGKGLNGDEGLRAQAPPFASTFSCRQLDAAWFIRSDADEFRKGPWPKRNLAESVASVDALGLSAIGFDVFNVRPTHDRFQKGQSVREACTHYESWKRFDKLQIRWWKKRVEADRVSTGGYEALFEGRTVFALSSMSGE